jgi:hypothetical protein
VTRDVVSRVRYFPGQFLRTPDFTDEQQYHIAMRRRHNIGQHSAGIVAGLWISLQDGRPFVEPGMAVDGYGRELVLVQRTPLDVPRVFSARDTDRLEVWLAYALTAGAPAPSGYAPCTDKEDASYRLVEQPVLRYTVPDPDETDRRRPPTVPEGDRDFGPQRTPPDDPIADWPVFLGTVTRSRQGAQTSYTVDLDGRPYAGLVGEEVRAVSGRTSVQVGAEAEDDPFRFAVRIAGLPTPEVPRLAVLADGTVMAVGETALLGNVEVGGVLSIDAGPVVADVAAFPPQPWTVSHVEDDSGHHQLRVQMAGPEGGSEHEVVVGTWAQVPGGTPPEQFVPCLTISSNCQVTVHGDLIVEGELLDGDRKPVELDEHAYSVLNASFLGGVAGASTLVDRFYRSPFPPQIAGPPGPALLAPVDVAERLAAESDLVEQVVAALLADHPEVAERLRTALGPSG